MPYAPGPDTLSDVYHSDNVVVNGVNVALWRNPQSSPQFEGPPPPIDEIPLTACITKSDSPPCSGTQADPNITAMQDNPDQFNNPACAGAGCKTNYAGTPNNTEGVISNEPPPVCESGASTVVPFLTTVLAEARKGCWRETGQFGGASNPNILSMWKNIGLGYTSDQTAWCAGFASFALKQSGLKWIPEAGASRLASRCAAYGGQVVPISNMQPGDLVLWSVGHVSFCYTANNGVYTFVGGNQSPGKNATPSVRDPKNDGDVSISWPGGWLPSKGGIQTVIHIIC